MVLEISLELFSLEKMKLWGDLTVVFQYLRRAWKKGGTNILAGPVAIEQGLMV